MTTSVDRMTVADWEARLQTGRLANATQFNPDLLAELRTEFQQQNQRARGHAQSPCLSKDGIKVLKQLQTDTLQLLLLAHDAIREWEHAKDLVVPGETIAWLLADVASRQREIEESLKEIQTARRIGQLTLPLLDELVDRGELPFSRFRPLIDQLLQPTASDPVSLVPLSELSWSATEELETKLSSTFLTTAIANTCWAAATMLRGDTLPMHLREAVVLAALTADLGQSLPQFGKIAKQDRRNSPLSAEYLRHAEISAAIINGVTDGIPEWPLLISQHHERIDGTGFPRKLSGRQISPASRLLGVIIRWGELLRKTTAPSSLELVAQAAISLWKESLAGAFDASIVQSFLSTIRPDLPAAVRSAVLEGTEFKLHSAHRVVSPPHAFALPAKRHTVPDDIQSVTTAEAEAAHQNWRASTDHLPRHAAAPRPAVP